MGWDCCDDAGDRDEDRDEDRPGRASCRPCDVLFLAALAAPWTRAWQQRLPKSGKALRNVQQAT